MFAALDFSLTDPGSILAGSAVLVVLAAGVWTFRIGNRAQERSDKRDEAGWVRLETENKTLRKLYADEQTRANDYLTRWRQCEEGHSP